MIATKHPRQIERLAALRRLDILDTPREAEFDDVVELASRICNTPIAVINLVDEDRQWFKAEIGLGVRQTPLDTSLCAHAILVPGLTVIEDTRQDTRMACNPLVLAEEGGLRFYAGALLSTQAGLPLGTLCVLDTQPRSLDPLQRRALEILAGQVMRQLELRLALRLEASLRSDLEAAQAVQRVLMLEVDHRVKNSLQMVSSLLRVQAGQAASAETVAALGVAQARVAAIGQLHEELHRTGHVERIEMGAFLERIAAHLRSGLPPQVRLDVALECHEVDAATAAGCAMVVNELLFNALKHAFPDARPGKIRLSGKVAGADYLLCLEDDGVGSGHGESAGLGRHIIQATAQRMEAVLVEEDAGPGLRVTMRLPG